MTVAPRKKTLDEICDIDELEKMVNKKLKIYKSQIISWTKKAIMKLEKQSEAVFARCTRRKLLRSVRFPRAHSCVNRFCDLQSSSLTK